MMPYLPRRASAHLFVRRATAVLLLLFAQTTQGQQRVVVPEVVDFANMRLELSNDARKKIQTDVDALTRYEKYYNAKAERINAYFPLIEQVLREEGVPDDIKYLVIQESALVGDAVSSSQAVGYWQFKEGTAKEVGLLVNGAVDERMNIITATRGAARYFKSNNAYFDNWLYALMAYYEGPGGALKKADKSEYGARKMRLRGNTHWYLLKYLSHKLAFEPAVGQPMDTPVELIAYTEGAGKTLAEVAREFNLEEAYLEPYNLWLRQRRIPSTKPFLVIVPRYNAIPADDLLAQRGSPEQQDADRDRGDRGKASPEAERSRAQVVGLNNPTYFDEQRDTEKFPVIREGDTFRGEKRLLINGIPGIIAQADEDVSALAERAGVSSSQLVRFNDLTSKRARVEEGMGYYLRPKKNRAPAHYHTVAPGENLWSISQRLGVKLKKLTRNNRMKREDALKPGLVLWLRFIRPQQVPVTYQAVPGAVAQPSLAQRRPSSSEGGAPRNGPDDSLIADKPAIDRPVLMANEEADASRPLDRPTYGNPTEDNGWRGAEEANRRTHTVAPRETLYGIARRYQLSATQLAKYNALKVSEPLRVGQTLYLTPLEEQAQRATQQALVMHQVQAGETMFQIARQHGVTIQNLMEWNNKSGFDLAAGEQLKVYK
ncbi:MAG: LysM peptidoglycan-binding domain-containing protein [Tunicatimonas sp.]